MYIFNTLFKIKTKIIKNTYEEIWLICWYNFSLSVSLEDIPFSKQKQELFHFQTSKMILSIKVRSHKRVPWFPEFYKLRG